MLFCLHSSLKVMNARFHRVRTLVTIL